MNQSTELLEETVERLFAKHCTPSDRQAAEADGWLAACWEALKDAGLLWLGTHESAGGSGGTVVEAAALVRVAGRHAVPLPVAECALLSGWLLERTGMPVGEAPVTVAVPRRGDGLVLRDRGTVSGRLARVPWGKRSAAVATIAEAPEGPMLVLVDPASAAVRPGRNVAGEPRDLLLFDDVAVERDQIAPLPPGAPEELQVRGALSRALLLAGAAEAASDLALGYASERQQFGRPIATFQAIAQRMVRMASEAEAATLAATVAAHRFAAAGVGGRIEDAAFDVAAARAAVNRAASEVAAQAHQIHGAIGMTQEYELHHFTRRIWAWCQEWGNERHWCGVMGRSIAGIGAEGLWSRTAVSLSAP